MQTLRMLGGIGLVGSDGGEIDALLRQPKSIALLAYLAMPQPGAWHRRDLLLATFWPELSQTRGRAALRSALHLLRRHLDAGAIRTRGDDEVGVDPELLTADVTMMRCHVAAGDLARALSLYDGDLLPALHIPDAQEFERWLDGERSRLRAEAHRIASALAHEREVSGDLTGAVQAARRASELGPDDEAATRRLIALLDRAGDRAQAHAVFESFRGRMAREFGTDPSAQTVTLMNEVRSRPAPVPERVEYATTVASTESPLHPEPPVTQPRPRTRWIAVAAFAAIVAVGALVSQLRRPIAIATGTAAKGDGRAAASASRRLVLLPIALRTDDSSQRYLATGLAYGLTRRLERIGSLTIRSGSPSQWTPASRPEGAIGRELGTTALLWVTLAEAADSFDVRASMIDSASGSERPILARKFARGDLGDLESQLAAGVMGAMYRMGVPFSGRSPGRPVDAESFRLTLLGFHQFITLRDDTAALRSFVRATEIDPLNARAWAGMSSIWGLRTGTDHVPIQEGYERTSAAATRALAIDSLQGSALASLGLVRALRQGRMSEGMPLVRRAMSAEPSNPEVFIIGGFLARYAHDWNESRDLIRMARQLDPLTPHYPNQEAILELCVGRLAAGERIYRELLAQNPAHSRARAGLARTVALQGRFDEALDLMRAGGRTGPPAMSTALATARGRAGYLAVRHAEGRSLLSALSRDSAREPVSRLRLMQAQFLAGDSAAGFAALSAAARERPSWIYRLPEYPALDEVRSSPRYAALLAEIGPMPQR